MKSLRILALATALLMSFSVAAFAAGTTCTKKVDSFDFVVDNSGSMNMKNKQLKMDKILVAKQALLNVNAAIPALDYYGGLHTISPNGTLIEQGLWDRASMANALGKLKSSNKIFGQMTYMGNGMQGYEPFIAAMKRPAAFILATDGDNNRGADLVATLSAMYAAHRDVVVHIISLADTPEGEAIIKNIAALNPATIVVRGEDLATSEAAAADFAMKVFCAEGQQEVIVLRGVNFAFDSSELDSRAMGILNEAAAMVKEQSNTRVVLTGYTDSKGSDAYNAKLSQRRAVSVKNYLATQGVPASRMTAIGNGKSFKYDNNTEDGAYMNRRTELSFK